MGLWVKPSRSCELHSTSPSPVTYRARVVLQACRRASRSASYTLLRLCCRGFAEEPLPRVGLRRVLWRLPPRRGGALRGGLRHGDRRAVAQPAQRAARSARAGVLRQGGGRGRLLLAAPRRLQLQPRALRRPPHAPVREQLGFTLPPLPPSGFETVGGGVCRYVDYCLKLVAMMQACGVIPLIVFDGGKLPMKLAEEEGRDR